jgi:hypothetical protein
VKKDAVGLRLVAAWRGSSHASANLRKEITDLGVRNILSSTEYGDFTILMFTLDR